MKERIQQIKADRFLTISFLILAADLIARTWQFYETRSIEPLLRVLFCIAFIITGFFFQRRFFYFTFAIFALVSLYWNRWWNFTSFFIVNECARKQPRARLALYILYGAAAAASLLIADLGAEHAIIHAAGCVLIYLYYQDQAQPDGLALTAKERELLDEWVKEKDLKRITCCSRNTMYERLKAARERNHIDTNEELKNKYQDETGTN